jgi:hypothetical protein
MEYLRWASVGRYGGAVDASLRWGGSRVGTVVRSAVEWVVTTMREARRSLIVAGGRPSKRLWMTYPRYQYCWRCLLSLGGQENPASFA